MSNVIGWDIGGAHLKAVQLNAKGEVLQALQLPCPLWKGLDNLQRAMLEALQALQIAASGACHAVTMTGELVDLFKNRQQGVCEIAQLASQLLGKNVWFYAINKGFVGYKQVAENANNIASANWHASAQCVAMQVPNALFLDIGSTTTDLIVIKNSQPEILGFSDAARLQSGELFYSGVVRTPLMALAKMVEFNQHNQYVTAEYFATTGDIYRLTDDLSEANFSGDTADNGAKTIAACAQRLARMVGWDAENAPLETWVTLANTYKNIQLNDFKMAINKQLARFSDPNITIVAAGAGTFVMPSLMPHFGCNLMTTSGLITSSNRDVTLRTSVCFPAYAVAFLCTKNQPC